MTATKMPLFEDMDVARATVRITNAGDGLSEALKIAPEEIELDEERSYVLQGKCVRVSVETDKKGITSRVHTIRTEGISPIDPEVAAKVIKDHAASVEAAKARMDGQGLLDDELAAQEREADDANLPPDEVAAKAAERAKRPTA